MELAWPAAAWVLGGFVRLVVAVEVSVTLPGTLDEAAPVGAAELFGSTRRVFCSRQREPTSEGAERRKRGRGSGASLTALLGLVGTVAAVVVVVAHEVLGDALSVLAHELVAAARVVEHWDRKKKCIW